MAKSMSPEKAAVAIIQMMDGGEAQNAKDAIRQRPELAPGEKMLKDAVKEPKKSVGGRLRTAVSGSGPMTLTHTAEVPPHMR